MRMLELKGISKNYGGIHALSNVDFHVEKGEAVGLMGDNGAGKSTLMKIIAGNIRPSSGTIKVGDETVQFRQPLDAREKGIEIVYQDLAICNNLTAANNVFLGREVYSGWGPFKWMNESVMKQRSQELFDEFRSETRPDSLVKNMSGGQRQAVAIARTRLSNPLLILMDEPTAAISVKQVAEVLELIKHLRDTGHGVILVSHRMPDVFGICDRVVVLRRGMKVADKPIDETSPQEVTGLIMGAIEEA